MMGHVLWAKAFSDKLKYNKNDLSLFYSGAHFQTLLTGVTITCTHAPGEETIG